MKQKDEISKISKQCMDSELVEVLIYIFHCYHQQYFEKLLYGTVKLIMSLRSLVGFRTG